MTNEKHKDRWLWYPGDFEIRHGLLQNFQREERGFDWPAYWYMDDCHRNVKFKRYYFLDQIFIKKNASIQSLKRRLAEESYSILGEQ